MKEFFAVIGVLAFIGIAIVLALPMRLCNEAVDVAVDEAGPRALLKKYQWFKDASAQLDKKAADMEIYDNRFKLLAEQYKGVSRTEWAREDREQYNLWTSEAAGIRSSYNGLAAEYNSAMAKENWKFCNVGDLPKGAEKPLPREYKAYVTK